MRNQVANLYNAASAPVVATRDALAERLQSEHKTASETAYITESWVISNMDERN